MPSQPLVLDAEGSARYFLEYRLSAGTTASDVRRALHDVIGDQTETRTAVAFGPQALRLLGLEVDLLPFCAIETEEHTAPATQRDVWVWVQGDGVDAVFDRVLQIHDAFAGIAELELDLRGFDYRNSHDLIGFVDGTANPMGEKAIDAAVIPDGVPGAGGSFVLTQQWVHDLASFRALPVEEQEKVIGRTKLDDIEFEGDAMPPDSHVSRTDVKVDGVAMKILRHSSPYGSAAEHGLYFVAFACEQRRFQIQLDRMFGVSGDGLHDQLVEYSHAVTGSYWFAPSAEELERLAGG